MKKQLFIFILFWGSFLLPAQNTYSLRFIGNLEDRVSCLLETREKKFLAVGGEFDPQTHVRKTSKGKLWQFGSPTDTLSKTFVYGDTSCYFSHIFELPGSEYLVFGNVDLPPNYASKEQALLILRLDASLNEIEHRIITAEGYKYLIYPYVEKFGEMFYVFAKAANTTTGPSYPCMMKLTPQLTLKKCRVLPNPILRDQIPFAKDCLMTPDSGQLIVFDEFACINFYDTAFNYLYSKTFPYSFNPVTYDLEVAYYCWPMTEWLTDSTFLMACTQQRTFNGNHWDSSLGFSEMDTSFSLVPVTFIGTLSDPDTLQYPATWKAFDFRTPDSIFFSGTQNLISWPYPEEPSWIIAGQLNRDLDIRFLRYYGGDAYYRVEYTLLTSDGGFMIAASRYDYREPECIYDAFFLKLNAEGQIVGTSKPDVCPESIFNLYPNPASEAFTLLLAPPKAEMQLYSLQGQTVLTQTLTRGENRITCQSLKPGTYLCKVVSPQFTETKKIIIK